MTLGDPMRIEELSDVITNALPNIKKGTLRFWGHWFGRPYDNIHVIVKCSFDQDELRLEFNGGEVLRIWSPQDLIATEAKFEILHARRIRWEWFYYGRPQSDSNLYYMDFNRENGLISTHSNIDFYTPRFDLNTEYPAVEIL